jgi:uncharacterized protein
MMEHNDIYRILENLDAAQKSVKQLPALFQPKDTSPQLAGPYPGRNATLGYLVGEGQDDTAHRVAQQILKQHGDARTADEDTIVSAANTALQQMGMTPQQIRGIMNNPDFAGDVIDHVRGMSENMSESATTEDVISTVKKKLGDYLQDVATAIKKDPDLMAKLPQTVDDIKATKTITTDDGKEIKIHGNEDDGFRISIRNQDIKTKFPNLDEAVMAVEMYCARRRGVRENADYIEEKQS